MIKLYLTFCYDTRSPTVIGATNSTPIIWLLDHYIDPICDISTVCRAVCMKV